MTKTGKNSLLLQLHSLTLFMQQIFLIIHHVPSSVLAWVSCGEASYGKEIWGWKEKIKA